MLLNWLAHHDQGAGACIGTMIGLIAVTAGLLLNAWLERRARINIRRDEAKSLAAALLGEVIALNRIVELREYVRCFRECQEHLRLDSDVVLPDIRVSTKYTVVYEANASRLAILKANLAVDLVEFYSCVNSVIEDFNRTTSEYYNDISIDTKYARVSETLSLIEYLQIKGKQILIPKLALEAGQPVPDVEASLYREPFEVRRGVRVLQ